ncbi:MAG: hypothetical protein ACFKPT_13980 [Gloeotrichia echinulata GP01]
MRIKTISCERVVNLGDYHSRRLVVGAEINEGEDVEAAITALAELVERKSREKFDLMLDINELRIEKKILLKQIAALKSEKAKLSGDGDDPCEVPC